MSDAYMVKQTISFSDGTETVMHFTKNENGEAIETASAELVAEHTLPEESETVVPEVEIPEESDDEEVLEDVEVEEEVVDEE